MVDLLLIGSGFGMGMGVCSESVSMSRLSSDNCRIGCVSGPVTGVKGPQIPAICFILSLGVLSLSSALTSSSKLSCSKCGKVDDPDELLSVKGTFDFSSCKGSQLSTLLIGDRAITLPDLLRPALRDDVVPRLWFRFQLSIVSIDSARGMLSHLLLFFVPRSSFGDCGKTALGTVALGFALSVTKLTSVMPCSRNKLSRNEEEARRLAT
jgi:hypothetical protein